MKILYIWYYTNERKPKGVPQQGDGMWLSEYFVPKKNDTPTWTGYYYTEDSPTKQLSEMPKELFLIIQQQKELLFDFVACTPNIMAVSENFLNFLISSGMDGHFESTPLKVVHRNEKELKVNKKYFAIRFGKFDNDLFEFDETTRKRAAGLQGTFMYPNMHLKEPVAGQKIFYISGLCYYQSLIFTEEIKNEIKEKFYHPEIYTIGEFPFVFNNKFHEEKLPPPQ